MVWLLEDIRRLGNGPRDLVKEDGSATAQATDLPEYPTPGQAGVVQRLEGPILRGLDR